MSWKPDIMITQEYYEDIKYGMPEHEKFSFNINGNDFIVICSGETTGCRERVRTGELWSLL